MLFGLLPRIDLQIQSSDEEIIRAYPDRPDKRKREMRHSRRGSNMNVEIEIGVMWPQVKEC